MLESDTLISTISLAIAKIRFMPELHEIKRTLSRIEKLERDVSLKQLQINSLLAITQAINDNVAAADLFNMYNTFLRWEM